MLVKINSATPYGLEAQPITVEVDIATRGLPSFDIIGLPSKTVDESRHRIKTALLNLKIDFPSNKKITVNLAPADLPKAGSFYDLPISLGIICLTNNINPPSKSLFFGEVSLDGSLRHTKGAFLLGLYAQENGYESIFLPESNAMEVSSIPGLKIFPVPNLKALYNHLIGLHSLSYIVGDSAKPVSRKEQSFEVDFKDILGQEMAKRSLEIAAAGGHNFLMLGPPGVGKTLLSQAFCSILPPLSREESLEVTKIYSAGGRIPPNGSLIEDRPFRAPHHSISYAGMVGGGNVPRPGEISLAHRGVLYMDEFAEFPAPILEMLRQPLESGFITISRSMGSFDFPCKFILLVSCNPCPCGFFGSSIKECTCTPGQVRKYRKKLSGPILDRIDLFTILNSVEERDYLGSVTAGRRDGESSSEVRKRICVAREIQFSRLKKSEEVSPVANPSQIFCNAEMKNVHIKKYCPLGREELQFLNKAVSCYSLSARAYFKTIKISRTIADLAGEEKISIPHISEALQHRIREF